MAGMTTKWDPEYAHKWPKDKRDWLEMFGNQWGTKQFNQDPLTAEEKAALDRALNPFA